MANQQPPTKKIKMFSSDSLVSAIPFEVWRDVIGRTLGYSDRLNLNVTCKEFDITFGDYKQKFLKKHAIHIPQDVRTIEKAMELVEKLQMDPTEKDPLRIVLDKGVHEIKGGPRRDRGRFELDCSHITFIGKGFAQTTILGGFFVENYQNVTFAELTISNPTGYGLWLRGSTVHVLKCVLEECGYTGMFVWVGTTVTATQCTFMENMGDGVHCWGAKLRLNDCTIHHNGVAGLNAEKDAVVDLHGTKTNIHSNYMFGIAATKNAKVNIHLPYYRTVGDTQKQDNGGSIANMNADGTFTHVVDEELIHY